jgi:polyisoprenoid-binding protein YceI
MRKLIVTALAVLILSTLVAADEFKIDPKHSSAEFTVRHMMISNVRGSFGDVSGVIVYDEKEPSKSSVTAIIKTASINTGNESRDKDLRSNPTLFDVAKYPEMKFQSERVEKRGEQWVAIGTLTIKDVSRKVELPFTVAKIETPQGTRLGVTSEFKLNRQEYGVTWNRTLDNGGLVVSNEVKIELSVEALAPPRSAAAGQSQ